MKILSLDISTTSTGYTVFQNGVALEIGTIANQNKDLLERGNYMAEFVRLLREKYGKFDHVVVEELKVLKNQKVLVMLGIVQGLILRELRDSPVTFVAPTVWRKHFGLNGERKKAKQGALALCEKLFVEVANDDEAESYLIALYFSTISLDKTKKV